MSSPQVPWFAFLVLIVCHIAVLLAGFVTPYSFEEQNRLLAFAPPTPIHFLDARHKFHLRPFVYRQALKPGSFAEYDEDRGVAYPLYLFIPGTSYRTLGIFNSRHTFALID